MNLHVANIIAHLHKIVGSQFAKWHEILEITWVLNRAKTWTYSIPSTILLISTHIIVGTPTLTESNCLLLLLFKLLIVFVYFCVRCCCSLANNTNTPAYLDPILLFAFNDIIILVKENAHIIPIRIGRSRQINLPMFFVFVLGHLDSFCFSVFIGYLCKWKCYNRMWMLLFLCVFCVWYSANEHAGYSFAK